MNSHFNFSFLFCFVYASQERLAGISVFQNASFGLFYPKTGGNDPRLEKYAKGASATARLLITLRGTRPLLRFFVWRFGSQGRF
jgi:hypothetical protein